LIRGRLWVPTTISGRLLTGGLLLRPRPVAIGRAPACDLCAGYDATRLIKAEVPGGPRGGPGTFKGRQASSRDGYQAMPKLFVWTSAEGGRQGDRGAVEG